MRKIISVFLVALMLFSVMAVSASAVVCSCGAHDDSKGANCYCCVDCPKLEAGLRLGCAKIVGDHYETCCDNCKGFTTGYACNCAAYDDCDCSYCKSPSGSVPSYDDVKDQIWGEEQQDNFVDGFQAVLKKISDAFDKFFDAIFKFLRIDEILGRN